MYNTIVYWWPVASSVINATSMLACSPVASELYNITVTCTIHPDSTADQCEVRAVDDGGVTRTGSSCVHILYKWHAANYAICIDCSICMHRFVLLTQAYKGCAKIIIATAIVSFHM